MRNNYIETCGAFAIAEALCLDDGELKYLYIDLGNNMILE